MPIEDIDEHLYKDYVLHLKSALDNDVSINSTVAVAVAIEEALSKRFLRGQALFDLIGANIDRKIAQPHGCAPSSASKNRDFLICHKNGAIGKNRIQFHYGFVFLPVVLFYDPIIRYIPLVSKCVFRKKDLYFTKSFIKTACLALETITDDGREHQSVVRFAGLLYIF